MANSDKRCAPNKAYDGDSCIPLDVLIRMAEAYNKTVDSNRQIKLDQRRAENTLNPNGYKKYLVGEFTKRLSNVCKDQICWTKQSFVKHMEDAYKTELKTSTFRPTGPAGRFTWLSTLDIDKVLSQYEKKYPEFKFLGAVPIDFDELDDLGLRNLNFEELKKEGKTKIGIIFNLDEHYKSGSHWVSAYADLENGKIYYSDSYGYRPEKRIRRFLRRVANHCQQAGVRELDVDYNKTRHQKEGSECGVYSINFILRLLKGEEFKHINSKRVPDKKINRCRNVYFYNTNI